MKITNTKSVEAYQLSPGTQIEIERPNLFFNEWGEQSLPVDLPDSDRNMALCGYPDMLGNVQRPRADIECTIQESDFCQPARMAILGAKRKENIQVSFYLNEGAFLSQLKNVKLRDIFGDETVDEISGLDNCLQFCRALMNNEDKRFAIFPVYIDDGIWKEKDSSIERNVIMLNDMTTTDFRMSKPCTIIRDEETEVTIDFEKGIPVGLNGKKMSGTDIIMTLNKLGGENGIGRADLVESRTVGMKSRGVYETPAGTVLYTALRELEMLTLDADTLSLKQHLSINYAELLYTGKWYSPAREALEAFMENACAYTTGSVTVALYKGNIIIVGRTSPYSIYNEELASFGESSYNHKDAGGFINLFGLPTKVVSYVRKNAKKEKK